MDLLYNIVDDSVYRQIIKSRQTYPIITDVLNDINQLEGLTINAVEVAEVGFDTIWDKVMANFHFKYLSQGFEILEKRIEERDLKVRLIVESDEENIEPINAIKYYDIRHLDNIRGNFEIMDNRAYLIYMLHQGDKPEQGFYSNSKDLIDKQQILFDKLWKIAIPLKVKNRQLGLSQSKSFTKIVPNFDYVRKEIISFLDECRKELHILSPIRFLDYFAHDENYWNRISVLIGRGVNIKILTDGYNNSLIQHMAMIRRSIESRSNSNNHIPIQIGNHIKLGTITDFILIIDDKMLLELRFNSQKQIEISILNEKNHVLVQEILFEKYWNELESLEVIKD